MLRRCEPLFDGDQREVCGAWFDDARRMAVCPHVSLDGGDSKGVAPDPEYLVAKGVLTVVDAKAMQARAEEDQLLIRQRDGSTIPMGEWMAHGNVAYQRTPSPSGPVQWDGDVHTDTIRHTIESQAARYVLVDVLDLAVLLQTAHAQDQYDGAVLDRVEKAPLATVPCTIKLNEDGGVWITPDHVRPAPDPRRPVDDGEVLPLLEDFDQDGHHRTCTAHHFRARVGNVGPHGPGEVTGLCDCAGQLRRVAKAWAMAYKSEPPRMTFVPAEPGERGMVSRGNLLDLLPDQVRTYGVYPASSVGEVVGFLNAHRELTPVAIIPEPLGTLMVLYVELRP